MSSTVLWYATRASGLTALVLLTSTMVLGITTTTRARARNWPGLRPAGDAPPHLHPRRGVPGSPRADQRARHLRHIWWAAIVVPFTSEYGRFWVGVGAVALDLMIAVFVTSLLRGRMRPGTWRAVHWLAYLSWPIALAHTFGMGTDSREGWVIVLGVVCVLSVAVALVWRLRMTSRQTTARTAHADRSGAPPKHLSLHGRPKVGSVVV